jgi:flagellin-like hook-associated protein FlgL
MVSIHTNTSSQITQSSLITSTSKLNKAIERLTTGIKINSASDNAANYSISNNLTTQISAYQIAEDNISAGISLLQTASDTVDLMYNNLTKIRSLAVQAAGSTLDADSLLAMNKEVSSLINEMYRTKFGTNYDGISLLGKNVEETGEIGASVIEVNSKGFIQDVETRDVSGMTSLASVDETKKLAKGTYSISSASELAKLATMQNAGLITKDSEFVLGNDIDLSDYSDGEGWACIGNDTNRFCGTFDGNGYSIKNLYISRTEDYSGLFGYVQNSTIENISIKGGSVYSEGKCTGGLIGQHQNSKIINCNTSVDVSGGDIYVGGLTGAGWSDIDSCYATGNVTGADGYVGGLCGMSVAHPITNSFAAGEVRGMGFTGGLIGNFYSTIMENCYATGDVYSSFMFVGGLIGSSGSGSTSTSTIKNCHATGNVTIDINNKEGQAGGLVGDFKGIMENCYATGNVKSDGFYNGGLIGVIDNATICEVTNCYATGNVITTNNRAGGLIGALEIDGGAITNCYATGNVTGTDSVGGLIGNVASSSTTTSSCYATGNVTGTCFIGGLIGDITGNSATTSSCYATGNVIGTMYMGGLIGDIAGNSATIASCYATGNVTGTIMCIGGLIGALEDGDTITNCYAKGNVTGTNLVGGLIGAGNSATVSDCYVLGEADNAQGAIAGYLTGTVDNCYYSTYYDEAGIGLVGSGSPTVTDCECYDEDEPFSLSEDKSISFQVGINGSSGNTIKADTSFSLGNLRNILYMGIENWKSLSIIDDTLSTITAKQTEYGTLLNRFDSAIDEISTKYENLVSARSTLKDADISKITSEYIRYQILQQASTTLLATANQNPSIALQLI